MNAAWDRAKASMMDAQHIAKLTMTQDGRYLDDLLPLVAYATDDQVRGFADALATQARDRGQP